MSYTDKEHTAALDAMVRDMQTIVVKPCPSCGEPADYEPESIEEEEVWGAIYRWVNPGCWGCPECGWSEVDND